MYTAYIVPAHFSTMGSTLGCNTFENIQFCTVTESKRMALSTCVLWNFSPPPPCEELGF